ncbi:sugar ABC transporter ATP-binding protein [Paeniglutamicibacter sp. ORCA_105]|uniref:sugar ABC transporter ATP-binding protein n=1 Tax=Paeniglutamicibacter sp. ORCA_105 TaxID=3377336 RepID=UPI0038955C23
MTNYAVACEDLSISFGATKALKSVTTGFERGKITALLGMNGSGKSTLIKVLAGIYRPDPGSRLTIGGSPIAGHLTPQRSHALGLRFLHQEVGLVEALTVSDNFAMAGRFKAPFELGPIDQREQDDSVAQVLERFNLPIHPQAKVADLSPTMRTMIGMARAFQHSVDDEDVFTKNVLVLDEPTASLPTEEVHAVMATVERLRENGGTVIYISHRTEEVKRLADNLVVLRDGEIVAEEAVAHLQIPDIVSRVVGKTIAAKEPRQIDLTDTSVVLEVNNLHGPRLRDLSLQIRAGEILGIAGLVGCGRSELIRLLSGAQSPTHGTMSLNGQPYHPTHPATAVKRGVVCVPQDRRTEGCVLGMATTENLTMGSLNTFFTGGLLRLKSESLSAQRLAQTYQVKTGDIRSPISTLSGGNQQKVVIARAASRATQVLLLDEPTQGVDALAKQEIWNIIRGFAATGKAVIVASTDFDEFVGLCDRVIVLDRGAIAASADGPDEITEEQLALLCAGADR